MQKKEHVILVDRSDNQVGLEEKLKAHELGLLHRAFSVFIFRKKDSQMQLLLQQRAKRKYHCGGLWANTCCSHPREGEDVISAGKRRLSQEMGIDIDSLKEVGTFMYKAEFENGLTEHEIDHVLIGKLGVSGCEDINFNKNEVESVRWISLQDLDKAFAESPEIFTPWFKPAFALIKKQDLDKLFE
ncbi:isopentenyl-diphosphate Delta-isomerase [Candidatus Dependentiae bacterium]